MPTQPKNPTERKRIELFDADLASEKLQKEFDNIYDTKKGDWNKIKTELTEDKGFTPDLVMNLEFTERLAVWSDDNQEVIALFKNDRQMKSMKDIALKLDKASLVAKVKAASVAESEEEKVAIADNLHRKLFALEPTAMLVNMVKNPDVPILNDAIGARLANVLENLPDFNIKTTSVYEVLKNKEALKDIPAESVDAVKTQLKTLQRIVAVSPVPEAVPALYNAKMHTAFQIAEMPQTQFLAMMKENGDGGSLDDNTLMQIHTNAQKARVRNEHALISVMETSRGTGVAMIDKSLAVNRNGHAVRMDGNGHSTLNGNGHATLNGNGHTNGAVVSETYALNMSTTGDVQDVVAKNHLSWDTLFGDADFCECGECDSVYSAAAYYVELLQYLRNNNLDPEHPKTGVKGIAGTCVEKLFDRRPDLACLELTCTNTNTILPYVDLVNEVMENYVAFKHLKPFNVSDETSSELLAEPKNTEYQAYCILKNAVYPFTLPYHQPIDATRIYLKYLETSRYELIDTFRKNNTGSDAVLTQLKDEAVNKAVDAEYLGLTREEYVILTKESFESKALMDKLKSKNHTETEYRELIGVKPVCKYYGYDDDTTMLGDDGLTMIKKEFLPRTGIDYLNLVEMLKTQFINPNMPKGKSKAIMESLSFSYRFLQNYAKVHGIDKMADVLADTETLIDMMPQLKDLTTLLSDKEENKKELTCPSNCAKEDEISKKDIVRWVKCDFEKVGKMIVIESGRGCFNGEILLGAQFSILDNPVRITVEDCKIYLNYGDVKQQVGSIDMKTGKVTFSGTEHDPDPETLKELAFKGSKGEKGVFMIIDNEVYLIVLDQQDTCDLDSALLQHLDGTPLTIGEYDKIHCFIRLWRKLGWTIDETDQAVVGLSVDKIQQTEHHEEVVDETSADDDCSDGGCADCDDCEDCEDNDHLQAIQYDINTKLIHELVAVKKLFDKTSLEIAKLLAFWDNIGTAGEKSLYKRVFLKHHLTSIDNVFKGDSKGNYLVKNAKITEHIPVIMAAFNMSADDIAAIMTYTSMEDKLTLRNVSILYRYRILSKAIGLKIPAFTNVLPLFGDVFQNAYATFHFIQHWEKIEEAGFKHQQLNYIIRNVDDEKKPFKPSEKQILLLAKQLYDGLNAIDNEHADLQAEASISDPALQDANIQEQATSALARAKASLLFESEVVEKILGLLEGTGMFHTNAPKNLSIIIADDKTIKTKLKYDKTAGSIQITGILTEAETLDFKALSNDPNWTAALTRIQKQQNKLFKEVLAGAFDSEKTKNAAEKTQLQTIITSGDISIALEDIPEGQADTNTAPKKRAAFLKIFLPYLRQELTHRFVIDALASFAGLQSEITRVLASEVLKLGTPAAPIYSIFEKIKETSKPDETNWSGYLTATSNAPYTFIIKNSDSKPAITIDGAVLELTVQEDPTNEWWSANVVLQPGRLYKLVTSAVQLKDIFWKTPASAIAQLPSSALIPDFASQQCEPALILLKKAALVVSGFDLSADDVKFLDLHKANFGNIDFNALTFTHWLRLEALTRFRNSLEEKDLTLLGFWKYTNDSASNVAALTEKIAALTTWKKERIERLIATDHFNIQKLEDFRNEENLIKLQRAFAVADKIGMDVDQLFDWAKPTSKFKKTRSIADGIKSAIRAKYNQNDWEQVVKPLHDQLRDNQKDALIAYLLQQNELRSWGVTDADGLFEFFLIDVQMEPCMETSRIKQAISSVQLFIQRCFLGLEEEHSNILPDALDRERWEWMQRYRVWEANRKVFLYPENWIESNLRDDKTPFFKELESELLQKDINKQNVTDALKSYLYKVDEVSNMEVVGLYIDGTKGSDGNWSEKARLHVFSRTRHAPFFFYYRYLALDEKNWYPWEKMQVDIPSFDVEDPVTYEVKDNGCYLTPVVWNGRLMVFFPHIMKKTRPGSAASSGSFDTLGNDSSGIEKSQPVEYFEIKMGWTEYRNGKWTQKQIGKDCIYSDPISDPNHRIEYLKFVPKVAQAGVTIYVDDQKDVPADGGFKGRFEFNGTSLKSTTSGTSVAEAIPITNFNQEQEKMYSWQLQLNNTRLNKEVYFEESNMREMVRGIPNTSNFHHQYSKDLLGKINTAPLEQFFNYNLSIDNNDFGPFDHDSSAATPDIYHELKSPYSLYNWELFFHTPVALADSLSKSQHFEEAMKWYHFVFNPIATGTDDTRFWQFKPFKDLNSQRILDSIFNNLKGNEADQTINEWRDRPFMPHVVARSRPVAYMKWVVMKYIDNLIAWGDYLFRQDTIESINQATQLYILASHILGPKPMMIPKRGTVKAQTYLSLLDKWDAFSNVMVELELAAPFSNQTPLPFGMVNGKIAFANIFGLASTSYFSIPNNPKLAGYWDTIADRLYKIRHCLNMQGVFRKLPLFEPPIDPALLVKAAAQGLSIASVLNDLNTPLPNYRFYYLLQKSLELCGELRTLGNSLLNAIEKKDNESFALLRSRHENALQNLVMEIRKKQLEEAQKNLETLEQNRRAPEHRMRYYLKLIGEDISKVPGLDVDFSELANTIQVPVDESGLKLISFEKEDMDKTSQAQGKQLEAAFPEKLASIMHIIPSFGVRFQPFGVGGSLNFGGSNLGSAFQAWAKFLQLDASELTFGATNAGKKAVFLRALQERVFQANNAGYEIKQIDKQITAQKIRIDIANQEILNHQKSMDNAAEVEEFLKNKYTNEELYTWMRGNLKTVYYQVYSLAYELAKKAEKVFRFERGLSSSNFIQSGYWDAGRDGLLAGEQLYVGLKQLESAYQSERGYDFEISKHVSLKQVSPLSVLQLRETGKCEFTLPEIIFDMDYPGHYKRRIKSLSVSIPCVTGPHTSVSATLRLMENKFRTSALNGKAYAENTEETDERFQTFVIPINAIAASNAQNDGGMFELNFKDERYLPFEGAGVISKWRLELPELRQFDYNTIPDVIIDVRYTACEGGEHLKKSAVEHVRSFVKSNEDMTRDQGLFTFIDLKNDLSTEWHKATTVKDENGNHVLDLKKLEQFIPYYMFANKGSLKATDIMLATDVNDNSFQLDEEPFTPGIKIGSLDTFVMSEQSLPLTNWKLILPEDAKNAKKMYMITRMVM